MFNQRLAAAALKARLAVVATGFALIAFLLPSNAATADEWQVSKVTGQVFVSSPLVQPAAVKSGMVLRSGQTLKTDANARAFLTHGNDSVAVGPNTVISVPMWSGFGMTKLVQSAGTTELEVEKLGRPHLTVETPYLAAVVKGTHFTVTVSSTGAKVAVTRGLVQVSDFRSGHTADVSAGQQASVTAAGSGVTVTGAGVAPRPATPSPAAAKNTVVMSASGDTSGSSDSTGDDKGSEAGKGQGSEDDKGKETTRGKGGDDDDDDDDDDDKGKD